MSTDTPSSPDQTPRRGSWINRYLTWPSVVALAVMGYLAFFGDNSVMRRMEYQHAIDSLNLTLAAQQDSLQYYRDLNRRLGNDPELMEQVAREYYNMNRHNEDVFVFEQ